MSTTRSITVWCDFKDCQEWIEGGSASINTSRKEAKKHGWTRIQLASGLVDHCPKHSGPASPPVNHR